MDDQDLREEVSRLGANLSESASVGVNDPQTSQIIDGRDLSGSGPVASHERDTRAIG